jgi:hypothetical protein
MKLVILNNNCIDTIFTTGGFMRFAMTLVFLCAFFIPLQIAAVSKPPITIAVDGFPTGQNTPEGVAADLARAFIEKDPAAFKRICIRVYNQGQSGKDYESFLQSVTESMAEEKIRSVFFPGAPKAIGKVFAVRRFSLDGPASYGYASFGFQDVAFVDVGVELHNGQHALNRTMVIKDRDGKWYVHPAPQVSPLLSEGLNNESPSEQDFSNVYQKETGKKGGRKPIQ